MIERILYLCRSNPIFLLYFLLFKIICIRQTKKISDFYDKCEPGLRLLLALLLLELLLLPLAIVFCYVCWCIMLRLLVVCYLLQQLWPAHHCGGIVHYLEKNSWQYKWQAARFVISISFTKSHIPFHASVLFPLRKQRHTQRFCTIGLKWTCSPTRMVVINVQLLALVCPKCCMLQVYGKKK